MMISFKMDDQRDLMHKLEWTILSLVLVPALAGVVGLCCLVAQ